MRATVPDVAPATTPSPATATSPATARSEAGPTAGDLATPAVRCPPGITLGALDLLFRSDERLRWVVLDQPGAPRLVSRSWLEGTVTGRLGYGRVVMGRRRALDVAPEDTVQVPAHCTVGEAAALTLRPAGGRPVDAVVVPWPDGRVGVLPVLTVFETLAHGHAHQALHDPLTGLPNRLHLVRELDTAGPGVEWTLCYIDLDRFKDVNDEFGHAAGDGVLVEFARRLRSVARTTDVVVRLGGDEFAVLTRSPSTPDQGRSLAERIVAVAATPFPVAGPTGQTVTLGASVGIASTEDRSPGTTRDSLLLHGDQAMYRAKSLGRGRSAQFDPARRDTEHHADEVRATPPDGTVAAAGDRGSGRSGWTTSPSWRCPRARSPAWRPSPGGPTASWDRSRRTSSSRWPSRPA